MTNSAPLTQEELAALRAINSPTIANAVEGFDVRPRESTYTQSGVQCLFPHLGVMTGYASTALIMSGQPPATRRLVSRKAYWEYLAAAGAPRITVMQDVSDPPGGAFWGEINTNIHRALGSIGLLTNGTVRDLDEVEPLGFHFFASGVSVSHGFAHLEDFNRPVRVFGALIHPGDLIHADKHGAVVIPPEVARDVIKAARTIEHEERVLIDLCKSPDFSIGELDKLVSHEY